VAEKREENQRGGLIGLLATRKMKGTLAKKDAAGEELEVEIREKGLW